MLSDDAALLLYLYSILELVVSSSEQFALTQCNGSWVVTETTLSL
jgi:hypothetical protein